MRILQIEDSESVCQRTAHLIFSAEIVADYSSCETLHEGNNRLLVNPPDLVILDLILPDANQDVSVRQIPMFDDIAPVLVLSGAKECFFPCLRAGAMDFLWKNTYLQNGLEAFWFQAIHRAIECWKYKRSVLA